MMFIYMKDANSVVELLRYEFSKQLFTLSVGYEKVKGICKNYHVGKVEEIRSF